MAEQIKNLPKKDTPLTKPELDGVVGGLSIPKPIGVDPTPTPTPTTSHQTLTSAGDVISDT